MNAIEFLEVVVATVKDVVSACLKSPLKKSGMLNGLTVDSDGRDIEKCQIVI